MSKFNISTNEICCKIDRVGFRSACLDVWFYKMPILKGGGHAKIRFFILFHY